MACSFVAKKLVAATRSFWIRHNAATVATNRRGFFFNANNTSIPDPYNEYLPNRIGLWVIKYVPHTLCRMSRVTSEGGLEAAIFRSPKKDPPRLLIPKGIKFSFNIPGIETINETDEGLCVFIDLGLNEEQHMKDFDNHKVEVKLKKLDALFIQGYVQKQGTRKNFYARVNFTPTQTVNLTNEKPIKTQIKDGGLMVTIPNKLTNNMH